MRLLQFNRDDGGANPQHVAGAQNPVKKPARRLAKTVQASRTAARQGPAKVFPVKTSTTRKPASRSPIDLEQLQQRIEILERRMQERTDQRTEQVSQEQLDQLKQRLKRLERNLENELWAAKQREHTMLQLLSKPPLKTLVKQHIRKFWQLQLPTAGSWLKVAGREWWVDSQPGWWPRLASAWQEALEQARR
jgi:hypothetical protein